MGEAGLGDSLLLCVAWSGLLVPWLSLAVPGRGWSLRWAQSLGLPRAPVLMCLLTSRKSSERAQEGCAIGWPAPPSWRQGGLHEAWTTAAPPPQPRRHRHRGPAHAGLSADYSFVSALGA